MSQERRPYLCDPGECRAIYLLRQALNFVPITTTTDSFGMAKSITHPLRSAISDYLGRTESAAGGQCLQCSDYDFCPTEKLHKVAIAEAHGDDAICTGNSKLVDNGGMTVPFVASP